VAYWKFDEGSGTSASDSSGNGYAGTLVNSPTWTIGKINGALNFDGSNYVSGSGPNIANGPFSISAWVKTSYPGSDEQYFSIGSNGAADQAIHLRITSNMSVRFGMWTDDLDTTLTDITNRWTNLVVTLDSSKLQSVYQDGVLKATRTANSFYIGDTSWNIGRWIAGAVIDVGDYFNGSIDDVRIYNRSLSGTEIQTLYQQDSALASASKTV